MALACQKCARYTLNSLCYRNRKLFPCPPAAKQNTSIRRVDVTYQRTCKQIQKTWEVTASCCRACRLKIGSCNLLVLSGAYDPGIVDCLSSMLLFRTKCLRLILLKKKRIVRVNRLFLKIFFTGCGQLSGCVEEKFLYFYLQNLIIESVIEKRMLPNVSRPHCSYYDARGQACVSQNFQIIFGPTPHKVFFTAISIVVIFVHTEPGLLLSLINFSTF